MHRRMHRHRRAPCRRRLARLHPQQFENVDTCLRTSTTALEILEDVEGPFTVSARASVRGTISGIGQVLKALSQGIHLGGRTENAAILSGGGIGTHLQMGIGDGLIPISSTKTSTTTFA